MEGRSEPDSPAVAIFKNLEGGSDGNEMKTLAEDHSSQLFDDLGQGDSFTLEEHERNAWQKVQKLRFSFSFGKDFGKEDHLILPTAGTNANIKLLGKLKGLMKFGMLKHHEDVDMKDSSELVEQMHAIKVIGERRSVQKMHEISTVSGPSSGHGASVRTIVRMGVHGDSTGRDYEAPNVNFGATPHKLCRKLGRMSAAELGKACAEIDATARRVIKAPWENPALYAGGTSLFDPTLGGELVFVKRGESRQFRAGDTVMSQHRNAGNNKHWYGRMGYRSVSALETYRADLPSNRLTSIGNGPWTLLPSKPRYSRRRDQLVRSVPQLNRTVPRRQSRETWDTYTPEEIFGNYRRFESYSLRLAGDNDTRTLDEVIKLDIVGLNRMQNTLKLDQLGKVFFEMLLEVKVWAEGFVDNEGKYRKAIMAKQQRDTKRMEELKIKAKVEREEADEALERYKKEREEFLKALNNYQKDKEQLEAMVENAELDGHIDEKEAAVIEEKQLKLRITGVRLHKEQQEFEEWEAKTQSEMRDYDRAMKIEAKTIQEYNLFMKESTAQFKYRSVLNFNRGHLDCSVLSRLHTFRPSKTSDVSEAHTPATPSYHAESIDPLYEILYLACAVNPVDDLLYACVFDDLFVGYEGQWADGQPCGHGVEELPFGVKYMGEFKDDLWHGYGMMAVKHLDAAYLGV